MFDNLIKKAVRKLFEEIAKKLKSDLKSELYDNIEKMQDEIRNNNSEIDSLKSLALIKNSKLRIKTVLWWS